MAIQVSKASLVKAQGRIEALHNKVKNIRKEGEHIVEKVLRTGETAGMAFGLGALNGYHGPITVMKMPLELLLAGCLELGGYLGLAGKHSDHLNNLGDGALSAYAVVKGVQIGAELKAKHSGASAPSQISSSKGSAMSAEDIRETVRQAMAQGA